MKLSKLFKALGLTTALVISSSTVWLANPNKSLAANTQNKTVKLTCSSLAGASAFVNWDILVQLNPDGTARSAAQQGDLYLTGIYIGAVERTDPASISITDRGKTLHFEGSGLMTVGIPNTPAAVYGVYVFCDADYHFPNPDSPYINW